MDDTSSTALSTLPDAKHYIALCCSLTWPYIYRTNL